MVISNHFSCEDLVHDPIETTIKKDGMFQVPGSCQPHKLVDFVWPIYNDLSRGHPKWWFSKGIPPKMALNQGKDL